MPKIFISYARADGPVVQRLTQALVADGVTVWRDLDSLHGGQQWPKVIGEAIAANDLLLLVWSQHAASSHFVELEWTTAMALRKTLLPCVLDDTPLPPALSAINAVDARQLAATLNDIGGAHWQCGIRVAGTAIHDHLTSAIQAYCQALEVQTRTDLPQDWAQTQNLGVALWAQGERTAGERGTQLLAEAVTAYRQALEVRTLETLPRQWAQTHNNLAKAYMARKEWANAATSYTNILQVYPDDRKAYQAVSSLYHDVLFQLPQAFTLNQQWLERHPEDLSALSDFAEKHFTTGRFAECDRRLAALLANPAVEPQINIALRAIEIANLLALDKAALVPGKIDTLLETLARQPDDLKVTWSFGGTLHFISQHEALAPYRSWLQQFFGAFAETDHQAMLTALQAARATFAAVVQ